MDGMPLRLLVRSFLFSGAVLALSACGQLSSEKASVPGAKDSGGGGSSPSPFTPVNDGAGFFLAGFGLNNQNYFRYIHEADAPYGSDIGTTNFSSSCKIPHGAATGTDLLCVAEVEELDLYFDTLALQYHVPSDMCTYLKIKPYWFYDYAPGIGPTVVSHEVLDDGTISDVINTSGGEPQCQYDYTTMNGANCCTGGYTHNVTHYASDGSFTTSSSTGLWGGKEGNCAAGPATVLMDFEKQAGTDLPLPKKEFVKGVGINSALLIFGPEELSHNGHTLSSNVWTANFYKPSEHTSNLPAGLQYPATISVPPLYGTPSDTYEFQCLDAAEEIKHRIRLFIREWNEESEMAEGGNPDTTGAEPGFPTYDINDRSDWLDFGDLYPASSI